MRIMMFQLSGFYCIWVAVKIMVPFWVPEPETSVTSRWEFPKITVLGVWSLGFLASTLKGTAMDL